MTLRTKPKVPNRCYLYFINIFYVHEVSKSTTGTLGCTPLAKQIILYTSVHLRLLGAPARSLLVGSAASPYITNGRILCREQGRYSELWMHEETVDQKNVATDQVNEIKIGRET